MHVHMYSHHPGSVHDPLTMNNNELIIGHKPGKSKRERNEVSITVKEQKISESSRI